MYRELGGPEWNRKDKWVSDKEISEWQGLSTKNGLIIKLEMNANNLCGRYITGMNTGDLGAIAYAAAGLLVWGQAPYRGASD